MTTVLTVLVAYAESEPDEEEDHTFYSAQVILGDIHRPKLTNRPNVTVTKFTVPGVVSEGSEITVEIDETQYGSSTYGIPVAIKYNDRRIEGPLGGVPVGQIATVVLRGDGEVTRPDGVRVVEMNGTIFYRGR